MCQDEMEQAQGLQKRAIHIPSLMAIHGHQCPVGILALEFVIHAKLLEAAAGNQQSSGICSSIVLVANRDTILAKFCRTSCANNLVTTNSSISDLAHYLGIREAH